jgi:hypothetical protein
MLTAAYGTELPIRNVRSSVANGGKADKISSMRVLRILTPNRHTLGLSIPESFLLLADKVHEMFSNRRVTWQATSNDENS